MNTIKIEVKGVDDRLALVRILAANGYTVRICTGLKEGTKSKMTYVEAWR